MPWKRGVKTAEPTNQLHWRGAPPPPGFKLTWGYKQYCLAQQRIIHNGCICPAAKYTAGTLPQYNDHLSCYADFHYKDKSVVRPSYLYYGNLEYDIGKTTKSCHRDQSVLKTFISHLMNLSTWANTVLGPSTTLTSCCGNESCPSFSEAIMVGAVLGGAVLVMNYFGAVSVEAVSEWGRFDQGERD